MLNHVVLSDRRRQDRIPKTAEAISLLSLDSLEYKVVCLMFYLQNISDVKDINHHPDYKEPPKGAPKGCRYIELGEHAFAVLKQNKKSKLLTIEITVVG